MVQYAVSSTLLIHLVSCYVLTIQLDCGVTGVAAATMVTCALNMTFLMCYSAFKLDCKIDMMPSNVRSLLRASDLKVYLGISGPSIIMLCAEWWAYEALTLMATLINVQAVGSMAISYNYQQLIFQFPFGFQIGATAVIGNVIGEENARLGKLLCLMTVIYSTVISTSLGCLTYTFSYQIGYAYTEDENTLESLDPCL